MGYVSSVIHVGQAPNIHNYQTNGILALSKIFWPVQDGWVVKGYKYGHRAIDIVVPTGSSVQSLGNGIVTFSGWTNVGYGYMVIVDHGESVCTLI
ncbi:MAG: peptidoglycan DD-metalloendopeptidase family protein [Chloroflexota bacterium]